MNCTMCDMINADATGFYIIFRKIPVCSESKVYTQMDGTTNYLFVPNTWIDQQSVGNVYVFVSQWKSHLEKNSN